MTMLSGAITLFLVLDPLGNIPVFLTVLKDIEPSRRNGIIIRELFVALAVLVFFLFFGDFFLGLLKIERPALYIAGAIVLFLISIKMIFPIREEGFFGVYPKGEPFIVPLAIPLVAGPSAITTVLILASAEPGGLLKWLEALSAAWLFTSFLLLLSGRLSRLLGERGLSALQSLMGMVLTTVSVQMFLNGTRLLLK